MNAISKTECVKKTVEPSEPSETSAPASRQTIDGAGLDGAGCFLNKEQVAKWLGVTVRTLDDYMRRGLVPYYKLGRTVRFRQQDLEQHLKSTCRVAGRSSHC